MDTPHPANLSTEKATNGTRIQQKNPPPTPIPGLPPGQKSCPVIAKEWEDPRGVPIDAFLFGGRRPSTVPLVHQAFDWNHGVFIGSIVGSEIFYVNWFRKTADGNWLWPGFGENSRVLKWVFERCAGTVDAEETAIGYMPKAGDINLNGLEKEITAESTNELLSLDVAGWKNEVESITEYSARFGDKLPKELTDQLSALKKRLDRFRKTAWIPGSKIRCHFLLLGIICGLLLFVSPSVPYEPIGFELSQLFGLLSIQATVTGQ